MNNLDIQLEKQKLYFIPLGGAGHFGSNLNVYAFHDRYLIADLGMGFPDEAVTPGVDLLLPDIRFLEARQNKVVGIVATHAHEDHIGGIPYLWPKLKCPIYATKFTAAILREKLKEYPWGSDVRIITLPLSSSFKCGPFNVELVTVTHSIAEPNALVIRAGGYAPILHTGDWKLDEDPIIGEKTDFKKLNDLANENILAVIGDSTNALVKGHSGSEKDVQESFKKMFSRYDNRIAVTCFSSNIARLESIAQAAHANGRHAALVGRSLWRMHDCAKECGYMRKTPRFLSAEEASHLPKDKVVYIMTGSQAEPRSALFRVAYDDHRDMFLEKGDTVIYSARAIPGNEKNIIAIKNALTKKGIDIVDEVDDCIVHVSGHPYQDELVDLYQRMKPRIAIPVHGETQMLYAHGKIAKSCQVGQTIIPHNGMVIEFDEDTGTAKPIATIETESLAIDGSLIVDMTNSHIKNRRRLSFAGTCTVSLVVDGKNRLIAPPEVTSWGLIDNHPEEGAYYARAQEKIADTFRDGAKQDEQMETARREVRRYFRDLCGKKPLTKVHIHQIKDY